MGLALPGVLGTGYGSLQEMMTAKVGQVPLWVLLALPFAKILATSLSIGTGGSGGIFGPGMVIGGTLGAALWRLGNGVVPGMPSSPAPFAIVAMMALFGSIAHARLAVMLMVAEMTGNLSLLAPAMIAIGAAALVVGNTTIYRSQLRSRADSPAHKLDVAFPLLQLLTVKESMVKPLLRIAPSSSVAEASALLVRAGLEAAPIINGDNRLVGIISSDAIGKVPRRRLAAVKVEEAMQRVPLTLQQEDTLAQALEAMAEARVNWATVVRGIGLEVVGILGMTQVVEAYRGGQRQSLNALRNTASIVERVGWPKEGLAPRQTTPPS
jgi:CIC family chloride channel protein